MAFPFGGFVDVFERGAGAGQHEVFRLGQRVTKTPGKRDASVIADMDQLVLTDDTPKLMPLAF